MKKPPNPTSPIDSLFEHLFIPGMLTFLIYICLISASWYWFCFAWFIHQIKQFSIAWYFLPLLLQTKPPVFLSAKPSRGCSSFLPLSGVSYSCLLDSHLSLNILQKSGNPNHTSWYKSQQHKALVKAHPIFHFCVCMCPKLAARCWDFAWALSPPNAFWSLTAPQGSAISLAWKYTCKYVLIGVS